MDQRNVSARWTTASEQNNELFSLERSSDGQIWEGVGNVPGAGSSTTLIDYEFIDHNVPGKVLYYRLRQTDHNGETSVSAIRVVNMPETEIYPLIYPNPNTGEFSAAWTGARMEGVLLEVIDATGRHITFTTDGANREEVNVHLAQTIPGLYLLKVIEGDQIRSTIPFFVQ